MARLTQDDLSRILEKQGHAVGHAAPAAVVEWLPHTLTQHNAGPAPHEADEDEEAGGPRIVVRITRLGTQLLDKDNLYGSTKFLCDALRYKGLIPEDDPESIHLIVQQRKVSKKETGTLIEIYPIT